jgi:hypothetical protein
MRPLVAHCRAGLARLDVRMDKQQEAQEYLTTAIAMYRDMGMTYWLEKAQAEMRGLAWGIPCDRFCAQSVPNSG